MTILDQLTECETWERFLQYKEEQLGAKDYSEELRLFIDEKRYLPLAEAIRQKGEFPLPHKSCIVKMGTDRKRIVYTYPKDENTVLKLLTNLMIRRYDGIFSNNLFSFRAGRTGKDGIRYLLLQKGLEQKFAYKADIHDYFNSIPIEKLLPILKDILKDEETLYEFLEKLLSEPMVLEKGVPISERKGIMAGTPQASFYANLYLKELDQYFSERGILYARYSDDIIVFGDSCEEVQQYAEYIHAFLSEKGLEMNPKKEKFFSPKEGFEFLGFTYQNGTVDIAPATVTKLKKKMKRKRDALARWAKRKGVSGVNAAKAFIAIFNRKLFESPRENELSWGRWFFPLINTTDSLKQIDHYAQDCIRYLVSGKHTKGRFQVRYEDIKQLGYRNLVHEYYEEREEDYETNKRNTE